MSDWKTVRALAALIGLAAGAGTAFAQAIDFEMFNRLTHKVIKVEAMNLDGSVSVGTGVLVGADFVVTNCHVTARARTIELIRGEFRTEAESQHADVAHDMCLLRAPLESGMIPATIATATPHIGQTVHAIGFIFGIAPRLNVGQINALHDFDGGQIIQSSTPFTSGASGGGLFDDSGQLVGIVTFRYRAGTEYHFSLPIRWVVDAMNHYQGKPVAPLDGIPFWNLPRDRQPYFLRAASFDAERNWSAMSGLAAQWIQSEPTNASAWRTLGKARYEQREFDGAIAALRHALSIDRSQAPTWYALGLAYAGAGNPAETARVRDVLEGLDGKLAGDLVRHTLDCADAQVRVC